MPLIQHPGLRSLATVVAVATGAAHIASLWFRELDTGALASLLQGTVYLFVALGLGGRSRLSLYLGIVLPLSAAALRLHYATEDLAAAAFAALLADTVLASLCTAVLWRRRNLGKED